LTENLFPLEKKLKLIKRLKKSRKRKPLTTKIAAERIDSREKFKS
jgi:hypothetical protein